MAALVRIQVIPLQEQSMAGQRQLEFASNCLALNVSHPIPCLLLRANVSAQVIAESSHAIERYRVLAALRETLQISAA